MLRDERGTRFDDVPFFSEVCAVSSTLMEYLSCPDHAELAPFFVPQGHLKGDIAEIAALLDGRVDDAHDAIERVRDKYNSPFFMRVRVASDDAIPDDWAEADKRIAGFLLAWRDSHKERFVIERTNPPYYVLSGRNPNPSVWTALAGEVFGFFGKYTPVGGYLGNGEIGWFEMSGGHKAIGEYIAKLHQRVGVTTFLVQYLADDLVPTAVEI